MHLREAAKERATKVELETDLNSTTSKTTAVSTEKSSSTAAIKNTITVATTTHSDQSSSKSKTPINKKSTTGTCELTKIVLCRHSFQEQHECISKCLPGHIFVDHHKKGAWKCDGWSFFGGILSTIAILAIAFVAYKYAKRSRGKNPEHNYSLM